MLDVYAQPWIPQWQIAANTAPAQTLSAPQSGQINYSKHRSQLESLLDLQRPQVFLLNLVTTPKLETLSWQTYFQHFDSAIALETQALLQELGRYTLYNVPLRIVGGDVLGHICEVYVPGIREYTPQVFLGDRVSLRQVAPQLMAPLHGTEYDAAVESIDRSRELLRLRITSLQVATMRFNVVFQLQAPRIEPMRLALALIQQDLARGSVEVSYSNGEASDVTGDDSHTDRDKHRSWLRSMLFPRPEDGSSQSTLNSGTFSRQWYDPALNYEQRKAVDSIRCRNYGQLPFLISGPPGTGKTKTLVETALQLLDSDIFSLLICAPSDQAADTLLQRLRAHLSPLSLFRLISPSRPFAEVPGDVLPSCFVEDNTFALPPLAQLIRYKITVTTCRDANMIIQAGATNQDIFRIEHGVQSILHPDDRSNKIKLHWAGLLIDEAAQATEPEAAIPLAVVAPPARTSFVQGAPVFIMAGDQQQLGPRTSSQSSTIEKSLFERLFEQIVYAEHPFARSRSTGKQTRTILTQDMLPIARPPFANLIRNYRSHSTILAMPSKLFYHDTLVPEATATDGLLEWDGWSGRKWPVLFVSNKGSDELDNDGGGWYNDTEARKACDYAASFYQSGLIAQRDICVISPFRAQVQRLRKVARSDRYNLWDVNIGPLEAFQGLESRVVILCTTRTRTRFLDEDRQRRWGIVHDSKKFNVAMTRAKEGLVVIGCEDVLNTSDNWRAFLSFCNRHNLREDTTNAAGGIVSSDGPVSILETALLLKEAGPESGRYVGLSLAADLDEEMMISGVAAELQLNDVKHDDLTEEEGERSDEDAVVLQNLDIH